MSWLDDAIRNGLIRPDQLPPDMRPDEFTYEPPPRALVAVENTDLPGITEKQFQQQVIDFARLHGWAVAHFRRVRVQRKDGSVYYETPAAADGAGWPDLALCHRKAGRLIFAELKVGRNQPTPEQAAWIALFRLGDHEAYVWRPEQWPEIERVLSGSPPPPSGSASRAV